MSKIHFAHANGFPLGSYRVLLEALGQAYEIQGVSHIGHDPRWPVDHNWQALVDEQLALLHQSEEPVWAVGHSLGGVLLYQAALKAPGYFKGLILLDPPLYISGLRPWLIKLAKRMGNIDKFTPASRSRNRRDRWDDEQAMYRYLRERRLFSDLDERCVWDYIKSASHKEQGQQVLNFQPKIEYDIFCNVADNLWNSGPQLQMPVAVFTPEQDSVIHPAGLRGIIKSGFYWQSVPGGHLFPLQYPESTAQQIQAMIKTLHGHSDKAERCRTRFHSK
ncbi:MAG: alpha/beta hydrolase [Oceanospirillum sp.]|nr:alpha/beta hydrolase [Oceanospirillum sp.]